MLSTPGTVVDAIRTLLSVFDLVAIMFLRGIFKVFYLVANTEIISGDVIKVFYSRIQLVLGIFMIFKLSMTVLNIIINPDSIKDQKQGPSKIITRVVVSLFLLTLIIPMNIPNAEEHSLNQYINDHGVLFGFLYKVQRTVMEENVLAKLILGVTSDTSSINEDGDVNSLSDVGNSMASTVLKVFVRINVKDENEPICDYKDPEGTDPGPCPNVVCPDEVNASGYAEENIDPVSILDSVNESCSNTTGGKEQYAFKYTPIISAVVMIVMALVVLGFTLDLAVRAIKLMVLRLLAPIPIISYVDPKNDQKGAFGNWVKTLTSTYVDLFVRLALIYFGLFVIQSLIIQGTDVFQLDVSDASFMVKGFAIVFIILGVLIFMRQAPKFIRDMLGLQGPPMSNVGLSSVLGGTAAFLGGAGLAGAATAAMNNYQAGSEAAAQGKPTGLGWGAGRDLAAQLRTGDKDARGGIIAGLQRSAQRTAQQRTAARVLDREYGITQQGLNTAKENMITTENRAQAIQQAIQSGQSYATWYDAGGARYTLDMSHYTDLQKSQVLAGATNSAGEYKRTYEKAAEIAKNRGLDQTAEEKYRASARERARSTVHNVVHPVQSRADRRPDRQGVGDRTVGRNRWHP